MYVEINESRTLYTEVQTGDSQDKRMLFYLTFAYIF